MTRFQVRRKLRKACSKAKYVALGTFGIEQTHIGQSGFRQSIGKATVNFLPTYFQNKYTRGVAVIGLGTASAVLSLGVLSPSASYAATIVSTELVLSVDVSGSVDTNEFNLQRQGYVNAFRNPTIQNQIAALPGGIAATLSYWSDTARLSVPWTLITDATSANAFADAIAAAPRPFFGGTGITNAINYARNLLDTNDFVGSRRVIDVSGDGSETNTTDANLRAARDNAVNAGIIINGLPILGSEANLDTYYKNNVIGGSGSFLIAANNFSNFGDAVAQKIGREVSPDPNPVPEPLTILGSLAAGGVGAVLRRKYKQQKDTAKV
ncbi:PEP-CTERM sorting domain-containing protein [Tolypothrix campylonemoides VB511288]|nr:PEP-CTERM sorting domain-containing protein [Tolypothrix campylonemoides VB511288]